MMVIKRSHRKSPKIKAVLHHFLLTLLLAAPLLGVGSVWAVDTDNDTLTDTFEVSVGRDPLVPDYLVSAGWNTTCGKDDSATNGQGVQCWGVNSTTLNNNMPTFTALTQTVNGSSHACAIDDGTAVCWGSNFDGRATPPAMTNVTHISAFKNHSCAVHDAGVSCWGKETVGQTVAPAMNNPQMVAVGDTHSCAIDENAGVNSVVCWGSDDFGESTPPGLTQPIFIAAGDEHNCVIDDLGGSVDVVCWGNGGSGRTNPPSLSNPVWLALGGNHSCAIDDSGVVCWGANGQGQSSPLTTTNPVDISLGYQHSCALSNEGIQCWGDDGNSQSDTASLYFDSDSDGAENISDAFPFDDTETTDSDNDGVGDNSDAFPFDPNESVDSDNDGVGDNEEILAGTDPEDPDNRPVWAFTDFGSSQSDKLGYSVRSAGDVNADGYNDFVAGAFGVGNGTGSAFVYSGMDLSVLYTFDGHSANDQFGGSVSGAGDVNNDGYDDIIVGAIGDDNTANASGSARILSGFDGSVLYQLNGAADYDRFGAGVGMAGDLNGDGYDDFMVAADGADEANVFSGLDASVIYTFSAYQLGEVAIAGDVNNDGVQDIIAGAPWTVGSARVYDGANGSLMYAYDEIEYYSCQGCEVTPKFFGSSVSTAGDVNNDGYDDFIISAEDDVWEKVRVYSGVSGAVLYEKTGVDGVDIGDFNADGYDDFVIIGDTVGIGGRAIEIYSGLNGELLQQVGNVGIGYGGSRDIANIGDIDFDGFEDFVVGVGFDDTAAQDAGMVRVFLSTDLKNDQDADGLLNSADTDDDGDGMPDTWEMTYGLNPLDLQDAERDMDGDGENNLTEYQNSTDPSIFNDGDSDGSSSYFELVAGTSDSDSTQRPNWHRNFAYHFSYRGLDNVGDTNGDGQDEFIMISDKDQVSVTDSVSGDVLYLFEGITGDYNIIDEVSRVGDINQDGYMDFAIGDPDNDSFGSDSGVVRVYSGVNGVQLYEFYGSAQWDSLGEPIADAGDVNGDAYPDIVIGTSVETVYVYSGADGSSLYTFQGESSSNFGRAIAGAGDVNNDGYADVVVGASGDDSNGSNAGMARVFSGLTGQELHTFYGNGVNAYFGGVVSSAGDINGDGYDDIAVTAHGEGSIGVSRIFSGLDGTVLLVFEGGGVSFAGDVDGDTYPDMAVYRDANDVRVISGKTGKAIYRLSVDGTSDASFTPFKISEAGDIDNDGYADILAGWKDYAWLFLAKDMMNDIDGDYIVNSADDDDDDDGVLDVSDVFPEDYTEWADADADGIGDNADQCDATVSLNSDNDNDGCDDATEDLDDDNDGMPDSWEITYGLNPLANDASSNLDGDVMSNLREYEKGTDPSVADVTTRNDFTNDDIAGWIWHGVSNGLEARNRTWSPDWAQSVPGWVVPVRTYPPDWPAQTGWTLTTTGDFNGDGDADWLWRNNSTQGWRVWQIEGGNRSGINGPLTNGFDEAHEWTVIGAADTDRDGDDDVVLNNPTTGAVIIWEMEDYYVNVEHSVGTFAGYDLVRIGDFDGDKDADFLFHQQGGNLLRFWEIEANAMVQLLTTNQTGAGFTTQCTGDFNNDGNADVYLLAANGTSKWFEYVDFVRQQQTFGANQGDWTLLGCGDYDGDGDTDILWSSVDGQGYNRLFMNENFINSATFYTNRYGGTNPANPGYGFEYRGNGN